MMHLILNVIAVSIVYVLWLFLWHKPHLIKKIFSRFTRPRKKKQMTKERAIRVIVFHLNN